MTGYGWVTLPSVILLALVPLADAAYGPGQLAHAAEAVLLVWPVGLASVGWVRRVMARHPQRAALGWSATTLIRMTVALAGGCWFFFGWDGEPQPDVALWVWIVVAYLSTLAAEVFVLAKPGWVGRGAALRKG